MGGPLKKQFMPLGGEPLLAWSLRKLAAWDGIEGAVIVAPADEIESVTNEILPLVPEAKVLKIVPGGAERSDSVRNGLLALTDAAPDDIVLIHDGVRPFLPVEKLKALVEAATPDGAILAVKSRDTVKRCDGGAIHGTLDREAVYLAQTPQAFPYGLIVAAHLKALEMGLAVTDDASVVEAAGLKPRIVEGDPLNIKVTTPEDFILARSHIGEGGKFTMRIGHGYDAHRLVAGRKLILGGVHVDFELGLLGHSDADALAHAVADACLGAAGLGDIGRHFPDTDPAWKGADSIALLAIVREKLQEKGLRVISVDATITAQKPKLAPHMRQMEENIANALGMGEGTVNVKATTTEGMGFTGRLEGIAAEAVALLACV